jgi:Cdc6-like AAA superfamily ATPase
MSVKVIHEEINRFLKSSDPEVLCIKGRWGVGKTFAWTRFIHEAIEISVLRDYSYVSLFGLNSLEDLRYSIFENTVPLEDLRKSNSSNFKQKLAFLIIIAKKL